MGGEGEQKKKKKLGVGDFDWREEPFGVGGCEGRQRDQLHCERTKRAVAVQCPCVALYCHFQKGKESLHASMPFSPFIRVRSRETQCASNKNATTINLEPYTFCY